MIDKRKVRLMTRAAIYEKRYGEEDIKITGYYQKDYSSLNTWITLIWVTAGFFLLAALMFLAGGGESDRGDHSRKAPDPCSYRTRFISVASHHIRNRSRFVLQKEAYQGKAENETVYAGSFPSGKNES